MSWLQLQAPTCNRACAATKATRCRRRSLQPLASHRAASSGTPPPSASGCHRA